MVEIPIKIDCTKKIRFTHIYIFIYLFIVTCQKTKNQEMDSNIDQSMLQLIDLRDELLLMIFKKLDNVERALFTNVRWPRSCI
jgi:hypothetical protein